MKTITVGPMEKCDSVQYGVYVAGVPYPLHRIGTGKDAPEFAIHYQARAHLGTPNLPTWLVRTYATQENGKGVPFSAWVRGKIEEELANDKIMQELARGGPADDANQV